MSANLPVPTTTLLDDEAFLGTYQPDFWSFVQRSLLIGFITSIVLGGILGAPLVLWPVIIVSMTVFSAFAFDDYASWMRHRADVWHLTSLRLIYENEDAPEQNAHVNLADIRASKRTLWKNLRIDLETGQSVVMKYLARPKAVERDIDTARLALMGTIADEADIPSEEEAS